MIRNLLLSRAEKLLFYSPYNFIRSIAPEILVKLEQEKLEAWGANPEEFTEEFSFPEGQINFFLKTLPWDTAFFGLKTVKLQNALFNCPVHVLEKACKKLYNCLSDKGYQYCFIEIPSEDITLIQALGLAGFKLIETRLTYFNQDLEIHSQNRYPVRKGTINDIPNLRKVASLMRNDYDRFHADPIFKPEIANAFLSKYIEEALKGFCDVVLVPDEPKVPSDSFLTANYNKADWDKVGTRVSKMVLSAVSSQTNKGWYLKLISEMTYHLFEEGAEVIYMNTQSTNRAVIKTWEKLGYRLGCTTHVLSTGFNN